MDLWGQEVPQKCPCANEIVARQEAGGRAIFVTRARRDPQVALAYRVGWLAPTRSCDLAPRTFGEKTVTSYVVIKCQEIQRVERLAGLTTELSELGGVNNTL